MPYEERKKLISSIEKLRSGRTLVSFCNFDRLSSPEVPGLSMQFHADLKECLYRVLKENDCGRGLDVFLYTRGRDTNSVWPIVCLLREFDPDFEVLVPFRCHSAGTMLALAAKHIIMTRLAELSPIDPTTCNQFNPIDPVGNGTRLGISVEDVRAYRDFVLRAFDIAEETDAEEASDEPLKEQASQALLLFINKLTDAVHPLALGNVHRVHQLVSHLAEKLLGFHGALPQEMKRIIRALTVDTYSHLHMIGREEAREILGKQHVKDANSRLETAMDSLLKMYEDDFLLRSPFFPSRLMRLDQTEQDVRFAGGVLESKSWGYLFETKGKIQQHSKLPTGVSVQVPPGQLLPLIPGMPREFSIEIHEQRWHHNTKPEGVTL